MVLPYLKGFEVIKCDFFYIALWIYCVFSNCGDYICRSILVLKTGTGNKVLVSLIIYSIFVARFNY
jgi:hypothetical protein